MGSRFHILLVAAALLVLASPVTAQTSSATPPPAPVLPPPPPQLIEPTVRMSSGDNEALSRRIKSPMLILSSPNNPKTDATLSDIR